MSSTFWKDLSRWATTMDKRAAEAKLRKQSTMNKPATTAFVYNTVHSLEGQIGRWFEQTSGMLVSRIHEVTAKHIGDGIQVCAELIRQQFENAQSWTEQTFKLYDNSMKSFFKAAIQYLQDMERNNAGRYLTVVNALDLNHNTNVAMYASLTEQIQSLKEPHKVYEPSLEWIMDNIDELVRFGIAVEALRDNNAPASIAKVHAVKSICAMVDIGMIDAKRALDNAIKSWGVVEQAEAA